MGKRYPNKILRDKIKNEERRATGDRILVHAGKTKEITLGRVEGNIDISKCTGLIGKTVKMMLPLDTHDIEKTIVITKVNPYNAEGTYTVGRDDNIHVLTTCLSISDLVIKGLLSFKTGSPKVVK